MIHDIRVDTEQFEEILRGDRTYIASQEFDCPFVMGDILALNEIEDEEDISSTTGRSCAVYVTSIARNLTWKECPSEDMAIVSIKPCILQPKTHPMDLKSYELDYSVPLATGGRKDGAE